MLFGFCDDCDTRYILETKLANDNDISDVESDNEIIRINDTCFKTKVKADTGYIARFYSVNGEGNIITTDSINR